MTTDTLRARYAHQLRSYIAARVSGPAVDDILQQVFLKAHQKLPTLNDQKATKSWLYRITQHTIIDWYRKTHGGLSGSMDDNFRDSLAADTTHDNQQTIAKNISSCLLPMINNLDAQSQKVLECYLQPDTSLQTIADQLGLSLSNVKVIIHRAKHKLKDMYQQCCYQYRDDRGNLIDTWCTKQCGCDNSVFAGS